MRANPPPDRDRHFAYGCNTPETGWQAWKYSVFKDQKSWFTGNYTASISGKGHVKTLENEVLFQPKTG